MPMEKEAPMPETKTWDDPNATVYISSFSDEAEEEAWEEQAEMLRLRKASQENPA